MTEQDNQVAVIGMAGRFPGADSVGALWRNLRAGTESIAHFDATELEDSLLLPARLREHPDFVAAGGILAGAELFDHDLFGLPYREAQWMDPQLRIFVQTAWAALEDAGYDPAQVTDRIAVYAGAGTSGHLLSLLGHVAADPASQYEAIGAGTGDNLATRVSFLLRLRGESITVHTACSTGLAAVHLACQSLLLGQSRMSLAGAVRVSMPQQTGYLYQEGMILSRDGHCRAFDHRASGTVPGSGVGVVILKTLPDALADGDHIHAVISGSALNNDGHRGVGYTAPSVAGQSEVIAEALAFAEVSPDDIGYVETHGTGTPLGDPIEIEALTRAYRLGTDRVGDCPIGSLKTNLGHLDAAAGIAGLIKVVLMLRHGEIPPSLHLERPNPAIDFASSPFVVNTELRPWPRRGGRRLAGVSSFGIGGTNVHAVLAEAPDPAPAVPSMRPHQLVTLSAHTGAALAALAADLAEVVSDDTHLADTAYTRAVGRTGLRFRRAHVAGSPGELAAALRAPVADRPAVTDPARVALLFPGQGSAHQGMASGLYDTEPDFRAALDECLAALQPGLDEPLLPVLCQGSGPIDDPTLAHPALFAMEYALARLWLGWGIRPAALLGHSFGEYATACVAGVLSLADAAALVLTRGELVAALPEGAMLAVALGEAEVADWLGPELWLAAVNGDQRCVVAGPVDAVAAVRKRLAAARQAAVPLPIRHAFHSPAVDPVLSQLDTAAAGCEHAPPQLPMLSGLTGDWWTAPDPGYWARQMRQPVRFGPALSRLAAASDEPLVLLEVGPQQALTALARDQLRGRATAVASLGPHHDADTTHRALLTAAGTLWCAGAEIDWEGFYRAERRRRIPLPTYPFQGVDCRLPETTAPVPTAAPAIPASRAAAGNGHSGADPVGPADQPPADDSPATGLDAPRDEVERTVAAIWQERLGTSHLGIHDNFLEAGANSLIAAQVLTRLRDEFGAPVPLSALFEAPTVAGLAERIRELTGGPAPGAAASGVPLSVVQERTLTLEAADPGNPALVMPVAVVVDGDLDPDLLQQAVQAVADRHETLRTTFHHTPGQGWTARLEPAAVVPLDHRPVPGGEPEAQRIAREEPTRPFDLTVSPVRARLLRLAADRHVLLLTVHHVVCDTLSLVVLVREITACYQALQAGEAVPLPPLPVQYADFAAWQRELLRSEALAGQRRYWRDRLADPPPRLALPTDHRDGGPPRARAEQVEIALPEPLSRQLTDFSQRAGVTPFVTLLAAYAALLARVTGNDDLVIGTPVGNRDRPELEGLVGYVAHCLPLRADLRGDPRFAALVRQVQHTLLAAYSHPDVPYEHLTDPSAGRLFDAALVLHADLPREQRLSEATWRFWQVSDAPAMFGATLAALTLMLAESPHGYAGTLCYADELFTATTAGRLFGQLQTLLAHALSRPETRMTALPLGSAPPPAVEADDPGRRRVHLSGTDLPRWTSRSAGTGASAGRPLQLSLSYFANDEDELASGSVAPGGKYRLLLAGARLADRHGLTAVWTPERHFHSFGGLYPSPTATNAALAATTERVGIRAGSVVVPLHDPVRVAEDWAVIDNLSGGRVGVSFASGWHPDDFVLAPDQFPQRRELLAEGIATVRALWRGEAVRRRNGVGAEIEVRLRPRPVQPELPFWLTAAGSPHTFTLAGQLGAGVLTNLMAQSLADLADKIALYRQAWREAGHNGHGHVTLMLHAFLADDAETAYATAREPLLRYFRSSVDVARGFAVAQGMAVRPEDLSEGDIQVLLEHGLERYLHSGGLFGTPDSCQPVLEQVRHIGVDEVAALVDYGTSVDETLHSIRLLGALAEQERQRAGEADSAATAQASGQVRELARTAAARPGDPVAGPTDALGWLADTTPEVLSGRAVLVTDVDPPLALLSRLSGVAAQVFVPAPELPDGSLPARWAQWYDGRSAAVAPEQPATVVDAGGGELGVGVVGELVLAGQPTGQRARWRTDGRLDLLPGPVTRATAAPLSYAQQRIWSIEQLSPGNIAYINTVALRLRGPLDTRALQQALQRVVDRHEVLRTSFQATAATGSEPAAMVVHPSVEVELPAQDTDPAEVGALARAHARQPFQLDTVPLLRARLLRLADADHVMLLAMHHIISDGWSAGVLVAELGGLYRALSTGATDPLPPLPMQYADYAAAQREQDRRGAFDGELDYWRRTLDGLPPLALPTDHPRPSVQGQQGARVPVRVDRTLAGALAGLCRDTGTTLFMVLHAALSALLHRHTGQTDLAIGAPVAGRSPDTEALVGVFINTVVIRVDLTGDPTFAELLARVRAATVDALGHQQVPFERLVDALKVPRDPGRAPLCQALLVLHNTPTPRVELGELTLEWLDVDPGTAKLDLTVELREDPDGTGIRGAIEYHTDLFEESTVAQLAQQYVQLLAAGAADPHRRLSALALGPAGAAIA